MLRKKIILSRSGKVMEFHLWSGQSDLIKSQGIVKEFVIGYTFI